MSIEHILENLIAALDSNTQAHLAKPSQPTTAPPAKPATPSAPTKPTNGAATVEHAAAPATPNPVTVAVETYAKVAAAFIVLGKAGQGATIQAILAKHNAAHAKQISDNAPALADVLKQAQAAIAALPGAA